jgi:hypothetical protein
MAKDNAPPRGKPAVAASHIILLADWAGRLAGTVLIADADRLSQLDAEGVPYRAASADERRLGAPLG